MIEHGPAAVVRAYHGPDDAVETHAAYRSAITRTAAADYEPEQITAWAGAGNVDLNRWDARRAAAHTFVAVMEGRVAGFVDFLDDGLLDMLFVHPDFSRRGVGSLLVNTVKHEAARAGVLVLRTFASRTARPAFEQYGFRVVAHRPDNIVNGQAVPNYEMTYELPSDN